MPASSDVELVGRLRARDHDAYRSIVTAHHPSMLRLARSFVPSEAIAEEVVQDTWLAVVKGVGRFEERSSLRTWIFRILVNQARTRGARERRTVPESSLRAEVADRRPSVPPERFAGAPGRGLWAQPPARWTDVPEDRLLNRATFEWFDQIVAMLPANQRRVVILRDVEGWTPKEVCDLLDISEGNQRVLLHRARSVLRAKLEAMTGAQP